jgi:Putative citrate transport
VFSPVQTLSKACNRLPLAGCGFPRGFAALLLVLCVAMPAQAADVDGSQLHAAWGIPFAGLLLSIALLPLMAPIFWHHHFGKVALTWSLAFLVPFGMLFGPSAAGASLAHAAIAEYIPFIVLLTALFTVAGGIFIKGNLHGSPGLNTAILASALCWPVSWVPPAPRC